MKSRLKCKGICKYAYFEKRTHGCQASRGAGEGVFLLGIGRDFSLKPFRKRVSLTIGLVTREKGDAGRSIAIGLSNECEAIGADVGRTRVPIPPHGVLCGRAIGSSSPAKETNAYARCGVGETSSTRPSDSIAVYRRQLPTRFPRYFGYLVLLQSFFSPRVR